MALVLPVNGQLLRPMRDDADLTPLFVRKTLTPRSARLPLFTGLPRFLFHALGKLLAARFAIPLFKRLIRNLALDQEFRKFTALSLALKGHRPVSSS